jgi:2,4'-dihydroxyacetophenone dioxygenase
VPLNAVVNHQHRLLSINRHRDGEIEIVQGVHIAPCFLDAELGIWVLYARFDAGTFLPKHFHTGTVHFYTTAGSWNYAEHPDDLQTEGSYLYEPGGSIHTFTSKEGAEGFMVVHGSNVNFDENDNYLNIMDAGWIEMALQEAAKSANKEMPRYIRPSGPAGLSK